MSEIENPTEDTPSTYGQMEEGATSTTPVELDSVPPPPNNHDSEIQDNIDNDDKGKRKLTFFVWNHFKKQKIDGVEKAIYNYCQRKLGGASKNGTRHLHDHFKICPLRRNQDIKQSILNPSRKKDGSTSLIAAHTFDQEFSRDKLAKMIILHERDILKIYESEKTKTKNSISDNRSRVAITTGMWTSNNHKRGNMVVTAHYIDDSWILRNRIIRFIYVHAPHTAKLLAKELMECLVAWSLEHKLSTLTLDNCSVNIAMMDQMKENLRSATLLMKGELVHMKCSAHILNLIVQEGLGAIQSGIETIRESVDFWTATPKRVEKF
ncbi:zinc finger BED domain-containing protein RICESLEEPER 2-like [Humulus lupulus]|uniref:zinc finger BED domain-containing protein RICESLEEPER 2-like n=1 Tax=Humulus lupulus TaxID=3486 RepID=UPI002B40B1A0|nr:zinc finger BED domain-containing protein RICESLEEPER 2-like [Humulus lupulus]